MTTADTATDTATAKGFFVRISANAIRWSLHYNEAVSKCLARAEVAASLAELPEDMALRARLSPDLFKIQA